MNLISQTPVQEVVFYDRENKHDFLKIKASKYDNEI